MIGLCILLIILSTLFFIVSLIIALCTGDTYAIGCCILLALISIITIVRSITSIIRRNKPFVNPYVIYTPSETGVVRTVSYPALRLKPDETLYYASPASSFISKEEVVGYSGGGSGVSVRITNGLSYHTGDSKTNVIRREVLKYSPGDYIVTSQRIVFIGINGAFEIPISNVSLIKPIKKDAFIILGGKKNYNIKIHRTQTALAIAAVTTVMNIQDSVE